MGSIFSTLIIIVGVDSPVRDILLAPVHNLLSKRIFDIDLGTRVLVVTFDLPVEQFGFH